MWLGGLSSKDELLIQVLQESLSLHVVFYTNALLDEEVSKHLFVTRPETSSLELCRDLTRGFLGGELRLYEGSTPVLLLEIPLASQEKQSWSSATHTAWSPVQLAPFSQPEAKR